MASYWVNCATRITSFCPHSDSRNDDDVDDGDDVATIHFSKRKIKVEESQVNCPKSHYLQGVVELRFKCRWSLPRVLTKRHSACNKRLCTLKHLLPLLLLSGVRLCNPTDCSQVRLLCPPLSSRVHPDSCPVSQWCYLTISSSASEA